MMGLAIAHHIREQVVFTQEVIEMYPHFHFNVERDQQEFNDIGGTITVV